MMRKSVGGHEVGVLDSSLVVLWGECAEEGGKLLSNFLEVSQDRSSKYHVNIM